MSSFNGLLGRFGLDIVKDQYSFSIGLYSGLIAISIVLVLAFLFRAIGRFKSSKGLLVKTPQGEMLVTTAALKEFISIELKSISDIKLLKIKLLTKGSSFNLLIDISAPYLTNIPQLTEQIQFCVENSLKDSLGITTAKKIDIRLRKFHGTKEQMDNQSFSKHVTFVEEESLPDATE